MGGGAAKAAYRMHKSLNQQGIQSTMLVGDKLSEDSTVIGPSRFFEKEWSRRIAPFLDSLPLKFLHTTDHNYYSTGWVSSPSFSKIKNLNPSLIHLHWVCGGFLSIPSIGRLSKLNKPIVWRIADMWPFSGAEHYCGNSMRFKNGYKKKNRPHDESGFDINRWVFKRKQNAWRKIKDLTIVAPSNWLAKCAKESLLLKDRPIQVIPTGQDIARFRPHSKESARDILNLPQDKKLILYGAVRALDDKRKGYAQLKSAIEELANNGYGNDYELIVFGTNDLKDSADFRMKSKVLGYLYDETSLSLAYSAADVFVVSSIEENLANTAVEAMACGTPVVSFDVGGMSDLIQHQANGYLAKPFAPSDLAQGILWVTSEAGKTLSMASRQTIEKSFSLDIVTKQYVALYEEILLRKAHYEPV